MKRRNYFPVDISHLYFVKQWIKLCNNSEVLKKMFHVSDEETSTFKYQIDFEGLFSGSLILPI